MEGFNCVMKNSVRLPVVVTTFRVVTAFTPPYETVMFTSPGDTAAAMPGAVCPVDSIDTTVGSVEVQVASVVTFLLEPSLYPATALNCVAAPTPTVTAVGDIETDVTTADVVTVKVVEPIIPLNEAETVAVPEAIPVARPGAACPAVSTDATVALDDDHVAEAVTSLVELSL
jgi:hypothetical protein